MEGFLFAVMLVVLIVRWVYLRDRMDTLERRLYALERAAVDWPLGWQPQAAPPPRPTPPAPPAAPPPPPPVVAPEPIVVRTPPPPMPEAFVPAPPPPVSEPETAPAPA